MSGTTPIHLLLIELVGEITYCLSFFLGAAGVHRHRKIFGYRFQAGYYYVLGFFLVNGCCRIVATYFSVTRKIPAPEAVFDLIAGLASFTAVSLVFQFAPQIVNFIEERDRLIANLETVHRTKDTLIRESMTPMAAVDLKMNYTAVSNSWITAYGLEPIDWVGKNHYEAFPESREKWEEVFNRVFQGEIVNSAPEGEYLIRHNGNHECAIWQCRPKRDGRGNILGILMFFQKVTDIVEQRRALAIKEEEVEQFMAMASHDLRSPFKNILTGTQLFTKLFDSRLDSQMREYMKDIEDYAMRGYGLTEKLTELAKTSNRKIKFTPCRIKDIIQKVLKELHSEITENKAVISFSKDIPCCMADADLIEIVFLNLIGNSIKFKQPTCPPSIQIEYTPHTSGLMWQFTIRDNSIGFDNQQSRKVFEPFRRLVNKNFPGSGLGLALCQRIIARHGGEIWCESQLGVGTTFCFTLKASYECLP